MLYVYIWGVLLCFFGFLVEWVAGFQRYAAPLQMAIPNKYGIYEFELVLEHRLTMSRTLPNRQAGVMDYNPEARSWTQRDASLFTECARNYTIVHSDDNALKKIEMLDDLVQHTGKHWRIVTINGQSPGETIVVPLGAEVIMHVKNRLHTEAVTVHLHGVDKRNMWYTDGVAMIQQCPIHPGSEHVYRFIADTPGTHWYHGHLMNDRADGLLGGFVIMRPDEVYKNANSEVVQVKRQYYSVLQDWATTPSSEQWLCHVHSTMKWVGYGFDEHDGGYRKQCWAPRRTFDGSNVGGSIPLEAILVGDQGWYSQEDLRSRPSALPLTTYLIRTGEHIIIRLVNGGVSQGFMLWIEDHEMIIVAADGASVVPKAIDALILFPGERYDIMIRGLDAPKKKVYRMIFETMEYFYWNWTIGPPDIGLANLEYEKITIENGNLDIVDFQHAKCTQESRCVVLNCPFGDFPPNYNYTCYSAHLLENAEEVEDTEILEKKQFDSGYQEIFMNMHFDNHIDGWMFHTPKGIPYYYNDRMDLIAKKCDREKCDRQRAEHWDHDCDCFYYCHFNLNDIIQLTVYNMGDGGSVGSGYSHPLHIHGTHFYVMKIGYAQYHHENGTISGMNPDIPCTNAQQRCVDLHWTNPDWKNGNVEGMQINPSFRDTVNIPTGGYVTLRFRASNPGWWFSHCHLMLHNMGGTAFAFRIGTHEEVPTPPEGFPHSCGVYEQPGLSTTEYGLSGALYHNSYKLCILIAVLVSFIV